MAVKVGVINVTGFAGMEAARILWDHPEARLVAATGRSLAGQKLGEAFPHLAEYGDFRIRPDIDEDVDVVLSALPTAESAAACVPFIRSGVRVIDIAADFRLDTAEAFAEWFGKDHPAPELLDEAVYGLPEINNAAIAASRLVANPGCYPEAAILAMAPAIAAGFVEPKVFVDAKSGVSGAGRGSGGGFGYANVNEDVSAYKIGVHNHQPEIAQELSKMSGSGDVAVTFVPHLVPMTRGIHATCYANLKAPVTHEAVLDVYRDFYRDGRLYAGYGHAPAHEEHGCQQFLSRASRCRRPKRNIRPP